MKMPAIFQRTSTLVEKVKASVLSAINSTWDSRGGWFRIAEPFPGAWQDNIELSRECVLAFSTLYSVITLIASDISKLRVKLVEKQRSGIWSEITSNAFSPVLRKPNHYQTHIQFYTCWLLSLLIWGNAYILKRRDQRGLVVEMYCLDPRRVKVMVATDGSIFYQVDSDYLVENPAQVTVPSSEIIHDIINPLFHPLCGTSPIFACGLPASTGHEIQKNATLFFRNGAKISGILQVPGALTGDNAKKLKDDFNAGYTGENAGKIAVLADGVKFQPLTMNSTDAQMIEILKLSSEQVCSAFHVPGYMVGVGPPPAYNNIEALNQQYYQQALQPRIESMEVLLDEGMGLPSDFTVEFDISQLLRMDTAARYEAYAKGIGAAFITPNEARFDENLEPMEGGGALYLQQQYFNLAALAKRDAKPDPFSTGATPAATPSTQDTPPDNTPPDDAAVLAEFAALVQKEMELIVREVSHEAT